MNLNSKKLHRREFLKTGGTVAGLSLGFNLLCPPVFERRALAGPIDCDKKLLFIFQRGGMDGINAVIPRGDSEYNSTNRPTLYVPEANAIDIPGSTFAQLHPAFYEMMPLLEAGDLAMLHRIGYSGQSQSHFDSQQYWENGTLDRDLEVGIFNRHLQASDAICRPGFNAAAISSGLPVALRGSQPVPNFVDPVEFRFRGTTNEVTKFVGQADGPSRGLLGFYAGRRGKAGGAYRDLLYDSGVTLTETMEILRDNNINPATYQPTGGAVYSSSSFGQKAKLAAQLFKQTPVQILGINLGGWDTHTNQSFGTLGSQVARAYEALFFDLQSLWNNLVIITMTEFGRTSKENGSFGTDHAYASAVFVAGGSVNGGVYNCDSTTWADGDMFSQNGRYLRRSTDFRSVIAEVFRNHFGDSDAVINQAIPGYDGLAAARPSDYSALGFI
jgi:uncharacterized protein (DUF1501 family)